MLSSPPTPLTMLPIPLHHGVPLFSYNQQNHFMLSTIQSKTYGSMAVTNRSITGIANP